MRSMTVAQLSSYIKGVFDDEELLHDITLSGEVTDISYSDKHTFLVLADGEFSVKCVHFFSRDAIEKGVKLILRGSVRFYDKRSSVTFSYTEFSLCGDGDKIARLAALKEKLRALGYFENRPQLPRYILSVAVVTSPDGAAIHDFIRVVSDKNPFVKIKVFPVKVQGADAADQIANAVGSLQSYQTDAIVICRGGGGDEDLDCFNDEKLAVAVACSRIPVISAVGHEVDYTLCDCCAGTRAGTPSIAGEIVNSRASALLTDMTGDICAAWNELSNKFDMRRERLERVCGRAERAISVRLVESRHDIERIATRGCYALDRNERDKRARLEKLADKLYAAAVAMTERKDIRMQKLSRVLSALDPNRIIKTGYAAVLADGKNVSSVKQLDIGKTAKLVFADGTATVTVDGIQNNKNA